MREEDEVVVYLVVGGTVEYVDRRIFDGLEYASNCENILYKTVGYVSEKIRILSY